MRVRRLLAHAVPLAGLVVLVVAVELVIVLGIGNVPTSDQRALLIASTVAAAVTAVLYVPLRTRLRTAAERRLLGARDAPANLLTAFGSRLAHPLPLDELLLQLVESLRRSLALDLAEVWTGSSVLERAAADPDAGRRRSCSRPRSGRLWRAPACPARRGPRPGFRSSWPAARAPTCAWCR